MKLLTSYLEEQTGAILYGTCFHLSNTIVIFIFSQLHYDPFIFSVCPAFGMSVTMSLPFHVFILPRNADNVGCLFYIAFSDTDCKRHSAAAQ